MVYEFEKLYIVGFIHMFIWWKKVWFCILFYFMFPFYDIWSIDYERERDVSLCFGEKYKKNLFAYICIVINKVYTITTWSNNSHTVK